MTAEILSYSAPVTGKVKIRSITVKAAVIAQYGEAIDFLTDEYDNAVTDEYGNTIITGATPNTSGIYAEVI